MKTSKVVSLKRSKVIKFTHLHQISQARKLSSNAIIYNFHPSIGQEYKKSSRYGNLFSHNLIYILLVLTQAKANASAADRPHKVQTATSSNPDNLKVRSIPWLSRLPLAPCQPTKERENRRN